MLSALKPLRLDVGEQDQGNRESFLEKGRWLNGSEESS